MQQLNHHNRQALPENVKPKAAKKAPAYRGTELLPLVGSVRNNVFVVRDRQTNRTGLTADAPASDVALDVLGILPPLYPEWLGDRSFGEIHGVRFPYVTGAMANGIATTTLVCAVARAGMLGFFGAAGLHPERVERAVDELSRELDPQGLSWGANLIHSPNEPDVEAAVVELYLRKGVRRVSASAYMSLSPHVVRYAATGLKVDSQGRVHRRNHVFAKISRPEVARHFMSPPPAKMLEDLVHAGKLTADEASIASSISVAEDIIVESDSGGHTDNQTLNALFPVIAALRDSICLELGYDRPIRVGAAGGLGTPSAVAAAFSLGAAFVLTGSVNQGAIQSGLSEEGRELLARAHSSDVTMAPAADMFELGVKVQVLKRGTMFGARGNKLYELYQKYDSLQAIPAAERQRLEKDILGKSIDEVWAETKSFWERRDPREVERATAEPRHQMALCFRWYLGQASRWAISGEASRRVDYQIWCGQAMGAFNDWARGSFLENPKQRCAVQIARNLLEGAATITRAQQLRTYGVAVPTAAFNFRPREIS